MHPFGFLGAQEEQHLKRLKQDRNLCAHPSFSSDAELYQPSPELVRTHIVHAVKMLLANPPIQGKAAIRTSEADVTSTAFPRGREASLSYVRTRYLQQMRPSAVRLRAMIQSWDPADETSDGIFDAAGLPDCSSEAVVNNPSSRVFTTPQPTKGRGAC